MSPKHLLHLRKVDKSTPNDRCRDDRPKNIYFCVYWAKGPVRGH